MTASVWCAGMVADRELLNEQILRLHVVANSDSQQDQENKLLVRDAVLAGIEKDLEMVADAEQAKKYLQENLPRIKTIAQSALRQIGCADSVEVSLEKECFDTRVYDTFALPAGVYEALRVTIGQGEGKNWWCVAFPALCIPAASEGFLDTAVGAGFSEDLSRSLCAGEDRDLRFFCLDALGKLENMFFAG